MFFTNFIDILDTVAPLVTLFFGVYGAVNDTKPKDGKVSRAGKVALTGMIISALITVVIKVYDKQQKFEAQRRQRIAEQEQARKKDSIESQNASFQLQTANRLSRSIDELATIKNKSETLASQSARTLSSLNTVTDKQQVVLSNTQRGLNPLFPLRAVFRYTVDIKKYNQQLDSHHRQMMTQYFNKLEYSAKQAIIPSIKAIARHSLRTPDTVNIPFVKNVNPIAIHEDASMQYGKSYFTALFLPKTISINLRKQNPSVRSQPSGDQDFIINYDFGSLIRQIRENKSDQDKIVCDLDMEKMLLTVEIHADSADVFSKRSGDFLSLFDLQNSITGIRIEGQINRRGFFGLNQVYLYTGYKFSKRTDLNFTLGDTSIICCGEIIARRIAANEIR